MSCPAVVSCGVTRNVVLTRTYDPVAWIYKISNGVNS